MPWIFNSFDALRWGREGDVIFHKKTGFLRNGVRYINLHFSGAKQSAVENLKSSCAKNQTSIFMMSNRTRSILKAVAVVLVAVVMQLQCVIIPSISVYKFWLV